MKKNIILLLILILASCAGESVINKEIINNDDMPIIPNTNVDIDLIVQELGEPYSYDLEDICTHPNINKWARFKPISHSKLFDLTEKDRAEVANGMLLTTFTTSTQLIAFYRANPNYDFTYIKPMSGNSSPYRIGDFRGYSSEAKRFYKTEKLPNVIDAPINEITGRIIPVDNYYSWEDMDYEIMGLKDAYFGVAIIRNNQTTTSNIASAPDVLGEGNWVSRVDVPTAGMVVGGTYEVYGFIGFKQNYEPYAFEQFIAIPDAYMGTFLYDEGLTIMLYPYRDPSTGVIEVGPSITNNGSSSVTILNAKLYIRYADNAWDSALEYDEREIPLGNLTIPSNSTTYPGYYIEYDALTQFPTRGGVCVFFR